RIARAVIAAYVPAAVALVSMRRRAGVRPSVTLGVSSGVPLAVAAILRPSKGRHLAVLAAYMWVFKVTWELPYDDPQKLRRRLQVRYPIRIDSLIGAGVPPTLRMQRALRDPTRVTPLDKAVAAGYASWFLPHLILVWIWLRHPQYIPRAAGRLAASYHLTTPFYYLLPTAPPWWASESRGEMNGEVQRVLRHVIRDLRQKPRLNVDQTPGNPWGSMPSDHVASAAITAMALSEVSVAYGVLGWTYVAIASFSVVYLGEHYVLDVIVGLAMAEAVHLVEPVVGPLVRRVARELESFAT
ncbi:MAG: phosphatase PAP2 family protein, partial [Actinomycetota bacterium]|nr:phosphatase PAP2 family protein [Actinomycetota bacterium]